MPRKSTGTASVSSTPNAKSTGRKSIGSSSAINTETETSLVIPPETKAVLKQQDHALKGIESFELPRTSIIRCAKTDLPDVVLRKDVQSALVKSATVFISFLTSIAHDQVRSKGGKIIAAQHVLDAVRDLGLTGEDEVIRELKEGLKGYREAMSRKKSDKSAVAGKKGDGEGEEGAEGEGEGEGNDADESRLDEADDGDVSVRVGDEGGDASMLRKSLNGHNIEDDEEEEAADQLMDQD